MKVALFVSAVFAGLAAFIWASDRITLEGERTIYTVACEQGVWDGLRCTGRIRPAERYRFRASRSRHEIVYWIAGSPKASGKYLDCDVTDRDRWNCKAGPGDLPTIAHELQDGKPVQRAASAGPSVSRRAQMEMVGDGHRDSGIQQSRFQQRVRAASGRQGRPPMQARSD